MKKVFTNSSHLECIFTDEGVTFYGAQQDVYLPYGCLDSIRMSLMGVLQAVSYKTICTFAVDRKDRPEMKEMLRFVTEAMKTAPKEELQVMSHMAEDGGEKVSSALSPEEQLKKYKELFIQGMISKEEYDVKKRQLKK